MDRQKALKALAQTRGQYLYVRGGEFEHGFKTKDRYGYTLQPGEAARMLQNLDHNYILEKDNVRKLLGSNENFSSYMTNFLNDLYYDKDSRSLYIIEKEKYGLYIISTIIGYLKDKEMERLEKIYNEFGYDAYNVDDELELEEYRIRIPDIRDFIDRNDMDGLRQYVINTKFRYSLMYRDIVEKIPNENVKDFVKTPPEIRALRGISPKGSRFDNRLLDVLNLPLGRNPLEGAFGHDDLLQLLRFGKKSKKSKKIKKEKEKKNKSRKNRKDKK